MKKYILFTLALIVIASAVFGQGIDTVAIAEPGGFRGFYQKYSGVIWTILGLTGLTGFFWYRVEKVRDALNVLIEAGQDRQVTEAEWQAIAAAFKKIWGKEEKK